MNESVWNRSILNNTLFETPLTNTLPLLVVLFCSGLIMLFLLGIGWQSLYWTAFFFTFIILSIVLVSFSVYRERRNSLRLQQLQALLEHTTNPIQVTDSEGTMRYVNPAFVMWSGIPKESLVGVNLFDRIRIANPQDPKKGIWMLAKEELFAGKQWHGEVEFIRPDNQLAVSSIILSPILNKNGKLLECIIFHDDLTERKEFTRKMVETQRQYRSIVESSLDGIMVVQNGRLAYVNPSAIRIFGYASAEEMSVLKFLDTVAPPSRSVLSIEHEGQIIGEEILRNREIRGLTKQAKMIDLEANALVIEWNDRTAVQISFRDITERKMLEREQALWLWEQETLSDIDRKLVGVVDLEKIFAAILQQTLNLTRTHFAGVLLSDENYTVAQWKSIRGNTLQHELEEFQPSEALKSKLKNQEPLILHDSNANNHFPLAVLPIIGEEKLVSTAWVPLIVEGKHKGMLIVGYRHYHDFAGREMRLLISLAEKHSIAMVNAQLYADLLQREKELEILSGARVQAQEDERRRIAREIHDGLGQMLTAIKFNLEILEDTITTGQEERERIDDMKGLLDSVMKEAREISYNLMPSVLEDFGLAPALQLLSEQFANRSNIKVQFQAHGLSSRLDPQLEVALYRIVQETLNNVAKHAEASEVNLQIIRHSQGVKLVVEDNGKGIVTQPSLVHSTGKGGMGLVGMRERAASFGGEVIIDSSPHSGTLISVEIPLTESYTHE
jgi:PAS domain S-box-containing protein